MRNCLSREAALLEPPRPTERPLSYATELRVPPDLREWMDEGTLLSWIEEEVQSLEWQHPLVQQYLRAHPEYHPRAMLSVLVFSYLAAVFDSESISLMCRKNAALGSICEGAAPFAQELSLFRRKNRALIEKVLREVLQRAIIRKFGLDGRFLPVDLREDMQQRAGERLDVARHMDAEG
jgi:transposase